MRHAALVQVHPRHRMDDEVLHCVYFVEGHRLYCMIHYIIS
jgi:hypothetical protein